MDLESNCAEADEKLVLESAGATVDFAFSPASAIGSAAAALSRMRAFLCVILLAGLGGLFAWQKQKTKTEPALAHQEQPAAAKPVSATASPAQTVSEHNWMKRSIDRARDVSQTARTKTAEAQQP